MGIGRWFRNLIAGGTPGGALSERAVAFRDEVRHAPFISGGEAAALAGRFAEALDGNDESLRRAATREIERYLKHELVLARHEFAYELARRGCHSERATKVLLDDLAEPGMQVELLVKLGLGSEILERFVQAYERYRKITFRRWDSRESWILIHGFLAFRELDIAPESYLPIAVELARDGDEVPRRHAVFALAAADWDAPELRPALLEALKAEDNIVKDYAARALCRKGDEDGRATEYLLTVITTPFDGDRRFHAVESLALLKVWDERIEGAFVRALRDEDCRVRLDAATKLCARGRELDAAVDALASLVSNEHGFVYQYEDEGLFREMRASEAPSIQIEAVELLSEMGPRAAEALEAASDAPNPDVRNTVAEALRKIRGE